MNLFDVEVQKDDDDPDGYNTSYARVGPLVGGDKLGLSIYELPPGQSICPYHYETGRGRVADRARRHADAAYAGRASSSSARGTRRSSLTASGGRAQGDERKRTSVVRVAIWSNRVEPHVSVYPDSDKLLASPPGKLFRIGDEVDYWEGEAAKPPRLPSQGNYLAAAVRASSLAAALQAPSTKTITPRIHSFHDARAVDASQKPEMKSQTPIAMFSHASHVAR